MQPSDMTDDEWRSKLTPEQYEILREKGTEAPGSGQLLYTDDKGMYRCAGCGSELFKSDAKYESRTPGLIGWPSFTEAAQNDAVELINDDRHGMHRTEVICKTCGGHLGHLFDDPLSPNGVHYCINSVALDFEKH